MDASLSGHPEGRIERMGDDLNPVLVKELRQAVQGRYVFAVLLTFLLASLGLLAWMMLEGRAESARNLAGREFFRWLYVALMGACLLFIPGIAGSRLLAERSGETNDLMFITSLAPEDITRGKLRAAAVVALVIFCACLPCMAIAYLMRGIDVPTIAVVLVYGYLTVLVGTSVAMMAAAHRPGVSRTIVALISATVYAGVCIDVVWRGMQTIRLGVGDVLFGMLFWIDTVPNVLLALVLARVFSRSAAGHFQRPGLWFWTNVRGDMSLAAALWVMTVFTALARSWESPSYSLGGPAGLVLLVLGRLTMPRFRQGRPPLVTPVRRAMAQTGIEFVEEDVLRERARRAERVVREFFESSDASSDRETST